MKMKAGQAIFAILDLVVETAAKQKAFHEVVISHVAESEEEQKQIYVALKEQSDYNIGLYKAKIRQYSELDIKDLFDGNFDFLA